MTCTNKRILLPKRENVDIESRDKNQVRSAYDLWSKTLPETTMRLFHNRPFQKILNKIGFTSNNKILDIGCGKGWTTRELAKNNQVTGMDLSAVMIKKAHKKAEDTPNVEFLVGDAENIPCENNYFGHILNFQSFPYYPNPEKALEEMKRILKPNGKLYLGVSTYGSKWSIHNIFNRLFDRVPKKIHSKEKYRELFGKANFKDIYQEKIGQCLLTAGRKPQNK